MFGARHKNSHSTDVTVSNRTVIRVILLVLAAVLGLAAVHQAAHALVLIFTAFFLTLALNAPVHWLAQHLPGKWHGRRSLATALSFLVVILLLAGFLAVVIPPIFRQTSSFVNTAPHLIQQLHDKNSSPGRFIRRHNLQGQVDTFSKQLSARLKNGAGSAVSTVTKVGSSIFSVLTILVLTFMMLIEGPNWLALCRDLIPDEHQKHADKLARDMYKVVKGYVNGQVTLAAIAAALILPAMILLHISYPIALMVVVFICGLIPMVGHTLGAIIVTIVAAFHSLPSAAIILAYYILYQQIENYIIQPRIQSNSTNMSPLLVFASVIIGVNFGGLFGGLVAIPAAGCIRIAVLDYLRSRRLIETETPLVETNDK